MSTNSQLTYIVPKHISKTLLQRGTFSLIGCDSPRLGKITYNLTKVQYDSKCLQAQGLGQIDNVNIWIQFPKLASICTAN